MLSLDNIDPSCTFRQVFNNFKDLRPCTLTGTGKVENGLYSTPNQDSKITYKDTSIGNFGTKDFSVRIITKISPYVNLGNFYNFILTKGAIGGIGFGIGIDSGNNLYILINSYINAYYSFSNYINKFVDIIFTRSANTVNIYINGILVVTNSNVSNSNSVTRNENFYIAGDSGVVKYSKQQVKLVELYNKALTANEISSMYDNSKAQHYNPIMDLKKWIKVSGGYVEDYQRGTSIIIKEGQKIFRCTSSGIIAYPSKQVVGTFEFNFIKSADVNNIDIGFINDKPLNKVSSTSSYWLNFNSNEAVLLQVNSTTLLSSTNSYIAINTPYRARITNTNTGIKSLYLLGGNFKVFTLVSTSGGSGTNPVTNNTYTNSNFFCVGLNNNDIISDIKFYPYIRT